MLTLALAIGANAGILAVVERVVLNPMPYPDSDRLMVIDHGADRLNLRSGLNFAPGLLCSAKMIDARISGCLSLETIFVMQPTEDRPRGYSAAMRQSMTG